MEIQDILNDYKPHDYKEYKLPPYAFVVSGEVFFSLEEYSYVMKCRAKI